jgi:hypothetical protein
MKIAPWPRLTRPPTSPGQAIIEVFPERVVAVDQLHLPGAPPVLDFHFESEAPGRKADLTMTVSKTVLAPR